MSSQRRSHDASNADRATGTTTGRATVTDPSGAAAGPTVGAPGTDVTGALANDSRTRDDALRRLRKIEGQVRGLQRMVGEGRYCADVLTQIASVQQALRAVGKVLMRTHLEHCITDALRSGDAVEAERAYGEVLDLMYRHAK